MTEPPSFDEQPISLPSSRRGVGGGGVAEVRQAGVVFREIVRALSPDPRCNPQTEAVTFGETTEPLIRAVLGRYGFDRLPATLAELYGLFEYCDVLDAACGVGMRAPDQLAEWQAASFEVWRRKKPALMPAIERFCAADLDGLKALHRTEDTLTRLGRDYLRPDD